ncbi:hypothetical protein BJ508DRAFT_337048, partial [Ascobolus immersus RN42]
MNNGDFEIVEGQKVVLPQGAEESTYWKYVQFLRSPQAPQPTPHLCAHYYQFDIIFGKEKIQYNKFHEELLDRFQVHYGAFGGGDREFTNAMTIRFLREVGNCGGDRNDFCAKFLVRLIEKFQRHGKKLRQAGELRPDPISNNIANPNIERLVSPQYKVINRCLSFIQSIESDKEHAPYALDMIMLCLRAKFRSFDKRVSETSIEALTNKFDGQYRE